MNVHSSNVKPLSFFPFHEWCQIELVTLQQVLDAFYQKPSGSNLHKLRIQLKKAKTIQLFINESTNGIDIYTESEFLLRLSKKSGIARQHEIQLHLLKKWNVAKKVILLKKKRKIQKNKTRINNFIKRHKKKLRSEISDLIAKGNMVTNEKSIEIAEMLMAETKINLQLEWDDSGLHQQRKRLKHLLYTLEWWQDLHFAHLPSITLLSLKELDKSIGQWHDVVDLLKNTLIFKKMYGRKQFFRIIDQCIAHCHSELENVHKLQLALR